MKPHSKLLYYRKMWKIVIVDILLYANSLENPTVQNTTNAIQIYTDLSITSFNNSAFQATCKTQIFSQSPEENGLMSVKLGNRESTLA